MLKVRYSNKFKKDYKVVVKRGYNIKLLREILEYLVKGEKMPSKHLDHPLHGSLEGFRECHILNDWLLVYKVDSKTVTLTLTRTGTHNDIF